MQGKRAVTSVAGAGISIVYLGVVMFFVVIQSMHYWDTSRPSLIIHNKVGQQNNPLDFKRGKHIPMLFANFNYSGFVPLKDFSRFGTIFGQYVVLKPTGKGGISFKYIDVPAVACRDLIAKGSFD